GRAHPQPGAPVQRARGRAPRPGRTAVEGDARADSRRALGRHALPAGGAQRDARRVLRAARLGRRGCTNRRAPGCARAPRLKERGPDLSPGGVIAWYSVETQRMRKEMTSQNALHVQPFVFVTELVSQPDALVLRNMGGGEPA